MKMEFMEDSNEQIRANMILAHLSQARNELHDALIAEAPKGVNRMIAVIREHAASFERDMEEDELYKKGGFQVIMKRELMDADFPQLFKNALEYL